MAQLIAASDNLTLAAVLRSGTPGLSWSDARQQIRTRRVMVNGTLCVDDARRLRAGDRVETMNQPAAPLPRAADVGIVYRDEHILVIEKPAYLPCERRPEEERWSRQRKRLHPTVMELLGESGLRVLPVHRLDRDTSGLMLYALSGAAQQSLVRMIAAHEVQRTYTTVVVGSIGSQTISNHLVRDRGDGLRGVVATPQADSQSATTHIVAMRPITDFYTLVECRLETGRTHQIRIHLAAIGHPVCGEKLYLKPNLNDPPVLDSSGAPRHALHASQLKFSHPIKGGELAFTSALPADLARWIDQLEKAAR